MAQPHTAEFQARIGKFQTALAARQLGGAILLHPTDIFYFSGTRQNGALFIPASGGAVLLIRKSLERARSESAAQVRPFPPSKELAAAIGPAKRIGLAYDVTPAQQLEWYQRNLTGRTFSDVSMAIREQRSAKSPYELGLMRAGAEKICAVFAEVPRFLRPGMRELDLAAEMEFRLRKAGNEGSPPMRSFNQKLFVGVCVAGDSGAAPGYFDGPVVGRGLSAAAPQGASTRAVEPGAPVILDYTSVFDGYVIDMTRTFVCGELPAELARAFEAAIAIQDEIGRGLRPGVVPVDLYDRAVQMAEQAGLGERFMGPPGEQARFVGHGVGLELDELPVLAPGFKTPLVAGQTLAIEPKFVFPGLGAVGIENTWAVSESGGERLTKLADALVRV